MNNLIHVSIAGIAFRLEEAVYSTALLFRSHNGDFAQDSDQEEILADIEARICELILDHQSAEVAVKRETIQKIIDQLGLPENSNSADHSLASPEANDPSSPKPPPGNLPPHEREPSETPPISGRSSTAERFPKRLYRNMDGAKLGGVCNGIATYFNTDPVVIRLLFAIPMLLGVFWKGTHLMELSFMIYLLLRFVVPKAEIARQKLEMRGEKITAASIGQNVRNDSQTEHSSQQTHCKSNSLTQLFSSFGSGMIQVGKVVFIFIALGFLFGGFALMEMGLNVLLGFSHIDISFLPDPLRFISSGSLFVPILFFSIGLLLITQSYVFFCSVFKSNVSRPIIGIVLAVWFVSILAMVGITMYQHNRLQENENGKSSSAISNKRIPVSDSVWVEEIWVGDSVYQDTVRRQVH